MSLEPVNALSPDLLALLDDERARPMAPEVDPDALFEALSESLDLDAPTEAPTEAPTDAARPPTTNAPAAPSAPPTTSLSASASAAARLGALKVAGLATAFALGGLTGAATYATLRRPERVVVERVVRVPVERVVQVPVERVVRVEVPVAAVPVTPPVTASTAPARATVAAAPETDLDREIALIDQATAALARDNHAAALASVREHQRRFPEGAMREDRERLWIDALVRSGRRDEALARAAEFNRRFPDSVHRARIARALAEPPPE